MSYASEQVMIETAIAYGVNERYPIQYGNTRFQPQAGTVWARVTIIGGQSQDLAVNSSFRRAPGVIDVAIFVPPDSGEVKLRDLADIVCEAIENVEIKSPPHLVRTRGARLEVLGRRGDWYQANLTIPYERETYPTDPFNV